MIISRIALTGVLCLLLAGCAAATDRKLQGPSTGPASASGSISRPLPRDGFSPDLSGFDKWNRVLARVARSADIEDALHAGEGVSFASMRQLGDLPLPARLKTVNDVINSAPYIPDMQLWGTEDHWATPGELMRFGGDCEDFAIAKYFALALAGVPDEDMRLTIVEDLAQGRPHAVLIVETQDGPVVLDNQVPELRAEAEVRSAYRFIYSLNRLGWWQYPAQT